MNPEVVVAIPGDGAPAALAAIANAPMGNTNNDAVRMAEIRRATRIEYRKL